MTPTITHSNWRTWESRGSDSCNGLQNEVQWGSTRATCTLTTGVPQGLMLGPLLFSLYNLLLGNISSTHGFFYHWHKLIPFITHHQIAKVLPLPGRAWQTSSGHYSILSLEMDRAASLICCTYSMFHALPCLPFSSNHSLLKCMKAQCSVWWSAIVSEGACSVLLSSQAVTNAVSCWLLNLQMIQLLATLLCKTTTCSWRISIWSFFCKS